MGEQVEFELNDYFINAGIVGFLKMLKNDPKSKYSIDGTKLYVDKDYLLQADLTELFIQTMNQEEQKVGKYPKILADIERMIAILNERDLSKDERNCLDINLKALEANSYKNIYEVLKEKNHYSDNLYDLIKIAKEDKSKEKLKDILEKILYILQDKEISEILFFREIAYRRINKFWDSVSFLDRNNATKDLKTVHADTFEKPFKAFLEEDVVKADLSCDECGCLIHVSSTNQKYYNYSFLKGTTADTVRKKNDFWNYKVNSWICPKCRFIYSLIPLGFSRYNYQYLFLNSNESIDVLTNNLTNDFEFKENVEQPFYQNILLDYIKKQNAITDNIEVIAVGEEENRFSVKIIRKEILIFMKENMSLLKSLLNYSYITINNIPVFQEVLKNLILMKDSYYLLQFFLKELLSTGNYNLFYTALYVFKIQYKLNDKRRGDGNEMSKEIANMKWLGEELRKQILTAKNTDDDDVLNSFVYKLLNAVRINDIGMFTNIVVRTCTSYKAPVPILLMKGFENQENFADLAYAYILGLKSRNPKKVEGENK